jgi:hypothetical protein
LAGQGFKASIDRAVGRAPCRAQASRALAGEGFWGLYRAELGALAGGGLESMRAR